MPLSRRPELALDGIHPVLGALQPAPLDIDNDLIERNPSPIVAFVAEFDMGAVNAIRLVERKTGFVKIALHQLYDAALIVKPDQLVWVERLGVTRPRAIAARTPNCGEGIDDTIQPLPCSVSSPSRSSPISRSPRSTDSNADVE